MRRRARGNRWAGVGEMKRRRRGIDEEESTHATVLELFLSFFLFLFVPSVCRSIHFVISTVSKIR
jgi:hypothetical protein